MFSNDEPWQKERVNRARTLRWLVALVFLALAATPFGGATAFAGGAPTAGMSMDGPVAADMGCCPDNMPDPATSCDKPACPTMATCVQQCIAGNPSTELRVIAAPVRDGMGLPTPDDVLASLGPEPPPRPPRI